MLGVPGQADLERAWRPSESLQEVTLMRGGVPAYITVKGRSSEVEAEAPGAWSSVEEGSRGIVDDGAGAEIIGRGLLCAARRAATSRTVGSCAERDGDLARVLAALRGIENQLGHTYHLTGGAHVVIRGTARVHGPVTDVRGGTSDAMPGALAARPFDVNDGRHSYYA
jgi:hypothetical protein